MIRKLQFRIILNVMLIFSLILIVLISVFAVSVGSIVNEQCNSILQFLASMDGIIPNKLMAYLTPTPFDLLNPSDSVGIFVVKQDVNGNIANVVFNSGFRMQHNELILLIRQIPFSENEVGEVGDFRYITRNTTYGRLIVCINTKLEQLISNNLMSNVIVIASVSWIAILGMAILLSFSAVKPVKEELDKQNALFSEVVHDIKSPCAIISVNADIITDEYPDNRWAGYIKSAAREMSFLINNFLTFTKLNYSTKFLDFDEFDLSKAVLSSLLPFESMLFEKDKNLMLDIQQGVTYRGNEEQIVRLVKIFLDNAIKYSGSPAQIRVTLKKQRSKRILTFYNTGEGIRKSEKSKIFQRFYCVEQSYADDATSFGLGLSIAESIVKNHKGRIHVAVKQGEWIEFTIILGKTRRFRFE